MFGRKSKYSPLHGMRNSRTVNVKEIGRGRAKNEKGKKSMKGKYKEI